MCFAKHTLFIIPLLDGLNAINPLQLKIECDFLRKNNNLYIRIGQIAFFFQPRTTRSRFGFAHEHVHYAFALRVISDKFGLQTNLSQAACVWIHGGVPQLLGVHFTQAFKARDLPCGFFHAIFEQFILYACELIHIQTIDFLREFLPRAGTSTRNSGGRAMYMCPASINLGKCL